MLLAAGAEGLVRGSSALALRPGVTPPVVGLTVVAFGTGSPELFVSVGAASRGEGGIALGDVVGSNISNVALILGLPALRERGGGSQQGNGQQYQEASQTLLPPRSTLIVPPSFLLPRCA